MIPRVSVLMPVRNAAETVERAARSILSQTLSDLELVAIDDGSTDESREILARLAGGDGRIRILEGKGRGLVAALNQGLAESRAPWVARMDADDESLATRLAVSVRALEENPGLSGVGTQVEIFRDDQPVSPSLRAYGKWLNQLTDPARLLAERFIESPLCHPSALLRREALIEMGGWEEAVGPEDYRLWLKLLANGHQLKVVSPVLFRWRDHPHRLTRTDARYSPRALWALKAEFLALELAGAPLLIWGTGRRALFLARALTARGICLQRFIEVHPRKIGQRLGGVPVCGVETVGAPAGARLLAVVGAFGAREEIRAFLGNREWKEGVDFFCAA